MSTFDWIAHEMDLDIDAVVRGAALMKEGDRVLKRLHAERNRLACIASKMRGDS